MTVLRLLLSECRNLARSRWLLAYVLMLLGLTEFLFRPTLIVLDEPTAGLDPLASAILKDRVQASVRAGASALLTSHVMSEVEELADEVLFLVDGKSHFHGSLEGLRHLTGEQRLERAVARLMRMRAA